MDTSKVQTMLATPFNRVLDTHGDSIARLLPAGAIQNDETMRQVADYCYEFLPWPVRAAVKKPAFTDFVLAQRGPIVAKLTKA